MSDKITNELSRKISDVVILVYGTEQKSVNFSAEESKTFQPYAPSIPSGYKELCFGIKVAGSTNVIPVSIDSWWAKNLISTAQTVNVTAWRLCIRT